MVEIFFFFGFKRHGAVGKPHLLLLEPVLRETGACAPRREKKDASDSQLRSQLSCHLRAGWLLVAPSRSSHRWGRTLFFIHPRAGGSFCSVLSAPAHRSTLDASYVLRVKGVRGSASVTENGKICFVCYISSDLSKSIPVAIVIEGNAGRFGGERDFSLD